MSRCSLQLVALPHWPEPIARIIFGYQEMTDEEVLTVQTRVVFPMALDEKQLRFLVARKNSAAKWEVKINAWRTRFELPLAALLPATPFERSFVWQLRHGCNSFWSSLLHECASCGGPSLMHDIWNAYCFQMQKFLAKARLQLDS